MRARPDYHLSSSINYTVWFALSVLSFAFDWQKRIFHYNNRESPITFNKVETFENGGLSFLTVESQCQKRGLRSTEPIETTKNLIYRNIYGIKCVGRIVTKSMSIICNFWRLIVGDCFDAKSQGWFLFGGNANANHTV